MLEITCNSVAQELLAKSVIVKKAANEGKLTTIEAYHWLDTGEVTELRSSRHSKPSPLTIESRR